MKEDDKSEYESSFLTSDNQSEKYESGAEVKIGFGKMAEYPVITMICAGIIGIGIGVGFSYWSIDYTDKVTVVMWLGLLGDLFIRSLKCIILPIVFVGMSLSMVEMFSVGKSAVVGKWTVILYLSTTLFASLWGILMAISFRNYFSVDVDPKAAQQVNISLSCLNSGGELVGGVFVDSDSKALSCDEGSKSDFFILNDLNNALMKSDGDTVASLSLSETLYNGFFLKLIPENIFQELYNANFAAVMVFAIAFGAALYKASSKTGSLQCVAVLREIEHSLLIVLSWVLKLTPFAVISLIISALGNRNNLSATFASVGALCLSAVCGLLIQVLVVYIGLTWLVTREMPFNYLRKLVPAQMTAFASASSAGTLPVTMQCVKESGYVKPVIAKFVLPLGATLNMDGSAVYICIAVIFLAEAQGLGHMITPATYPILVLLATIGSAGTAPVPSASLALILTAFNTLFPTATMGSQSDVFGLIFAIDWLIDRLRTVINVTGDCCVTRMISHIVGDALDEEVALSVEHGGNNAVNLGTDKPVASVC